MPTDNLIALFFFTTRLAEKNHLFHFSIVICCFLAAIESGKMKNLISWLTGSVGRLCKVIVNRGVRIMNLLWHVFNRAHAAPRVTNFQQTS